MQHSCILQKIKRPSSCDCQFGELSSSFFISTVSTSLPVPSLYLLRAAIIKTLRVKKSCQRMFFKHTWSKEKGKTPIKNIFKNILVYLK